MSGPVWAILDGALFAVCALTAALVIGASIASLIGRGR